MITYLGSLEFRLCEFNSSAQVAAENGWVSHTNMVAIWRPFSRSAESEVERNRAMN